MASASASVLSARYTASQPGKRSISPLASNTAVSAPTGASVWTTVSSKRAASIWEAMVRRQMRA